MSLNNCCRETLLRVIYSSDCVPEMMCLRAYVLIMLADIMLILGYWHALQRSHEDGSGLLPNSVRKFSVSYIQNQHLALEKSDFISGCTHLVFECCRYRV